MPTPTSEVKGQTAPPTDTAPRGSAGSGQGLTWLILALVFVTSLIVATTPGRRQRTITERPAPLEPPTSRDA